MKQKAFFLISKELSVAKNHLSPEGTPLRKKALQELPLDGSATFLSLMVQEFSNFVKKDQFYLMSV